MFEDKVFWSKFISNVDLHRVNETPAATDLIRRRLRQWIGHVLRKESKYNRRILLM